jgi:magnesium transporter
MLRVENAMSILKLTEILEKQKIVGGIVHNQEMQGHDLVEALLNQQHAAEISKFIATKSPTELGEILDSVDISVAKQVWEHIPEDRENDVLWEISEARREILAEGREPEFQGSRVCVFELADGKLKQIPVLGRKDLDGVQPIWVDLVNTTRAEREFIGTHFSVGLPDPLDEMTLEISARFHIEENGDIHLHSNFVDGEDQEEETKNVHVAFILHHGILFSTRSEELAVFRIQRRRILNQPGYVNDCIDVLLDLYGSDVEFSSDTLEKIYGSLGHIGKLVLNESISDDQAAGILSYIAEEEGRNGRIRSNILDTQRAISFLIRSRILNSDQIQESKQILRNIESLNNHTSFLFDKINFLMDATVGFININQNKRVNQLTVFGVVFMPINILAGIGGMSEFSMMTHAIPWPIAYGAFLVGSAIIGYATFLALKYFERRGAHKIDGMRPSLFKGIL